jgi:hypothetical protein
MTRILEVPLITTFVEEPVSRNLFFFCISNPIVASVGIFALALTATAAAAYYLFSSDTDKKNDTVPAADVDRLNQADSELEDRIIESIDKIQATTFTEISQDDYIKELHEAFEKDRRTTPEAKREWLKQTIENIKNNQAKEVRNLSEEDRTQVLGNTNTMLSTFEKMLASIEVAREVTAPRLR